MPRTVYLIIFNSPLFPAHWALFIPHTDNPSLGKYLNATGDAANGFMVEFERNYELGADGRRFQKVELGHVAEEHVIDVKGDGKWSVECEAKDGFEEVVKSVVPPGKSLAGVDEGGGGGNGEGAKRKRKAIRNYQTWVRDVVVALVGAGVVDEEAVGIVDGAQKN